MFYNVYVMGPLIRLLFALLESEGIVMTKEISSILRKIGAVSNFSPSSILEKEIKKQTKQALNSIIKDYENKLRVLKGLQSNPAKIVDLINKKLNQDEKTKLGERLSENKEGIQVFLSSSWIEWAIWTPVLPKQNLGTLTLKLKTPSKNNPSGIYNFPLHGLPTGYGPYVPREVYEMLKISASAGTTFWQVWYRKWYNTHRKIEYKSKKK